MKKSGMTITILLRAFLSGLLILLAGCQDNSTEEPGDTYIVDIQTQPRDPLDCEMIGNGSGSPSYDMVLNDWNDGAVVLLIDSNTGQCEELLRFNNGLPRTGQVVVSPDGGNIAFVDWINFQPHLFVIGLQDRIVTHLVSLNNIGIGAQAGQPSWSPDGTRISYLSRGMGETEWDINIVDLQGNRETIATVNIYAGGVDPCAVPAWSPAGNSIAYWGWDQARSRWVIYSADVATGQVSRLLDLPQGDHLCRLYWSHDGTKLAFRHWHASDYSWSIDKIDSDGLGYESLAQLDGGYGVGQGRWSPDDSSIAFVQYDYSASSAGIYTVNIASHAVVQLMLIDGGVTAGHPQWSPDGKQIAYTRFDYEAGAARVGRIPGTGGQESSVKLLNIGIGGGHPQWLPSTACRDEREEQNHR